LNEHYTGIKRRYSNSGDMMEKIKQAGMPAQAARTSLKFSSESLKLKTKYRGREPARPSLMSVAEAACAHSP
jgi:hypothetical protein